jgi:hypothetical protein
MHVPGILRTLFLFAITIETNYEKYEADQVGGTSDHGNFLTEFGKTLSWAPI